MRKMNHQVGETSLQSVIQKDFINSLIFLSVILTSFLFAQKSHAEFITMNGHWQKMDYNFTINTDGFADKILDIDGTWGAKEFHVEVNKMFNGPLEYTYAVGAKNYKLEIEQGSFAGIKGNMACGSIDLQFVAGRQINGTVCGESFDEVSFFNDSEAVASYNKIVNDLLVSVFPLPIQGAMLIYIHGAR
jgi:hypothetical protein